MIDSFHSDDDVHQFGIVVVNMLDQFGLCTGWSGNENHAGVCNRFSDGVKVVVIRRGVPAPDGVCLVMDMFRRMVRVQNEPFDICWAEVEYPRFPVIDPNDGMIVMRRSWNWFPYGDPREHEDQ